MTRTPRAGWTAWIVAVLVLVGLIASVSLGFVLGPPADSEAGSAAIAVAIALFLLSYVVVALVVLSHRPGHTVGRLMLTSAALVAVGTVAFTYVDLAARGGHLPLHPVMVWLVDWSFNIGGAISSTFVLLVLPNGRLLSRRWKVVVWTSVAALALVVVAIPLMPELFDELPITNPIALPEGHPVLGALSGSGFLLVVAASLASVGSLLVRFRRAAATERQQLKWIALAVLVIGASLLGTELAEMLNGSAELDDDVGNFVSTASLSVLPVGIGMAVLRYRLYDIDRIVSRTVSYAVVTVLVIAVYLGSILSVQTAVRPVTGSSDLAVAVSTLIAAALFQPMRRRVRSAVDRRFNRSSYDAQRIVERFGQQLRSEVDLPALVHELRGTVTRVVAPDGVGVWLSPAGRR